ncbi:MAG: OFA family MFS transporter [Bacillota bacterium]|nr:OFA family MFS transporter [Bacillota bacterium]
MQLTKNRWQIIVSAILIQLCLGAIYAWGVFLNPIMSDFGWSKTEVSVAFTIFLVSYAGATLVGGRWQDEVGPRRVATVGGILLGLGYYLASFTQSLPWLYITYGFIGGTGVGLGYVCPIATCVKWFPDKRGMATGLSVAGFGAGALIFAPVATRIIETFHWRTAFSSLGILFVVVVVLAAQILRNPPEGWQPFSLKEKAKNKTKSNLGLEVNWLGMLQTTQFKMLWLMFAFGATAGLMVIGHLASYGVEVGLTEGAAALIVGTLAFFNGSGRVAWGAISDRIGRPHALMLIMFILGATMLLFTRFSDFNTLLIVAGTMGLAFGGILAIFPSITADYFGSKNVGANYGVMFSAYGAAGVLGPMLGATVYDLTGTYNYAAVVAAILCFIAGALAIFLKPPTKKEEKSIGAMGKYSLE